MANATSGSLLHSPLLPRDPVLSNGSAAHDAGEEAPVKACAFRPKPKAGEPLHVPDKQSVAASLVTLLLTMPALLGTCCWPVLLAGIIGISATAASKNASHTFSLALTMTVLTNLAQFMAHKAGTKRKDLTHWQRYGPTYLLVVAIPFVLADQVRHCLQDSGIWPEPSSSMYKDDCESHTALEHLQCLTPVGLLFTIAFTYTGFILMVASILWSTNLPSKIKRAWSTISAGKAEVDCGCDV